MNRTNIAILALGVGIGGSLVVCSPSYRSGEPREPILARALSRTVLPAPAFARSAAVAGSGTMADVAGRVVPSVVNISAMKVIKRQRNTRGRHPFFDDPFFRQFMEGPFRSLPNERREKALGSGIIVTADGVVLTNSHVVEQTEQLRVILADGTELEAEVIGADPKSDIAVLRLKETPKGLTPLPLGNSEALRLGDVVLAVGNPFGVGQTVTMGIVSALGRANVGIVDYEDFIQTDAAINPGNSGGALVNMQGELVGINTAILSRSGGYQGIGFAIPSQMAKPIMDSLMAVGKVVRGWLGVGIQELDKDLASALKLSTTKGVLISHVERNGPADKAGIKRGDVVIALANKTVDSTGRLQNLVASQGVNASVQVKLIRDGKTQTRTVKLGERPNDTSAIAKRADNGKLPTHGLAVTDLTPEVRSRFRVPDSVQSGVVVTSVASGSAAARTGVRPGDVILEANQTPISSARVFSSIAKQTGDSLLLLLQRGTRTSYQVIRTPSDVE